MEGNTRLTNTSPVSDVEDQEEEVVIPSLNPQAGITQADTQEETLQPIFKHRRHWHQKDQYTRRPKYRTHRSSEYRRHR